MASSSHCTKSPNGDSSSIRHALDQPNVVQAWLNGGSTKEGEAALNLKLLTMSPLQTTGMSLRKGRNMPSLQALEMQNIPFKATV